MEAERREGRNVYYRSHSHGLDALAKWVKRYRVFWPERVEKLKLRHARGGDHVSRVTFGDRLVDNCRRISRSGLAEFLLRLENFYLHLLTSRYSNFCHTPVAADLSTASSTR